MVVVVAAGATTVVVVETARPVAGSISVPAGISPDPAVSPGRTVSPVGSPPSSVPGTAGTVVVGGRVVVVEGTVGSLLEPGMTDWPITLTDTANWGSLINMTIERLENTRVTLPTSPEADMTDIPTLTPSSLPTLISTVCWKFWAEYWSTWVAT